jgi:hypothetical protein
VTRASAGRITNHDSRITLFRVAACAALLAAACATLPPSGIPRDEALKARVEAILRHRGLGPDALSVIDNIIRHDATPAPPYAPPVVRELLANPLAAADAQTLFYRAVPGTLRRIIDDLSAERRAADAAGGAPVPLRGLLDAYLGDLADAQRVLRTAARGEAIAAEALVLRLRENLPSPGQLRAVAAGVDRAALDRATSMFLNATARLVGGLRAAGGRLQFPDRAVRFESAVGTVVIGTRGDDVHDPGAAVIVDPGGNDTYVRAPATGGVVSVIVDLGGNDRYSGSDLAVHALSAIVDFSGDDIYAMAGAGIGAAIAGAAIVLDFSGDDRYTAELFGEGAAAFGLGAIVDLAGNDTYRLGAGGQGLGLAGGVGLLWDRGGNDTYVAAGLKDVYGRGGGLSWAQGAAFGYRTPIGGGIGILRDDSGNDLYEAEMYAQGAGYYYGLALLWDAGGNDRYRAARYAQGGGVHEAVGVLRDDSGNDRYEMTVGVGQGMGLDLAAGVLFDGAGDDRYRAPHLAQGAATANGLGILADGGGADHWHVDDPRQAWGRAGWARGLPTLGVLVYDPARAAFARKDGILSPSPGDASLGGPHGDTAVTHEPPGKPRCAAAAPAAAESALPLAGALRRLAPAFAGGPFDPAIYSSVQRRLTARLEASLGELPRDDFDVTWSLGQALRCALAGATAEDAAAMWSAMEGVLAAEPATPYAGVIAGALGERPAPALQMERIVAALDTHPACGVRAAALRLRGDLTARAPAEAAAQTALRSACWRLQAAALVVLRQLRAAPDPGITLPSFLRRDR